MSIKDVHGHKLYVSARPGPVCCIFGQAQPVYQLYWRGPARQVPLTSGPAQARLPPAGGFTKTSADIQYS